MSEKTYTVDKMSEKTYTVDDIKHYPDYHREMWDYVVKAIEEGKLKGSTVSHLKAGWLMENMGDYVQGYCFACHLCVKAHSEEIGVKNRCPLSPEYGCTDSKPWLGGCLSGRWNEIRYIEMRYGGNNEKSRPEIAKEIRDLPWNWDVFPQTLLKKWGVIE